MIPEDSNTKDSIEWSDLEETVSEFRSDCVGFEFQVQGLFNEVQTLFDMLQARISHPNHKTAKTYWAQVEGEPSNAALEQLRSGVRLKDGMSRPAKAGIMPPPEDLWPRDPPIRVRKSVPDTWINLTITEGRNRQVRRMTAAVGHPTLRLIRYSIGDWTLDGLQPGTWREV